MPGASDWRIGAGRLLVVVIDIFPRWFTFGPFQEHAQNGLQIRNDQGSDQSFEIIDELDRNRYQWVCVEPLLVLCRLAHEQLWIEYRTPQR